MTVAILPSRFILCYNVLKLAPGEVSPFGQFVKYAVLLRADREFKKK